jgi:hypothetical protein
MNTIKDRLNYALSDDDIKKYGLRIVNYGDLRKYKNIDELLPNPKFDSVVFFVERERTSENIQGHWNCLVRCDNKNLFFFDSYGERVDKCLLWSDNQTRKVSNQNFPLLSYLLNQALDDGYTVEFNVFQFQEDNTPEQQINTCGKWCIVFINYMKHCKKAKRNFEGFHDYIMENCKEYNMNCDEFVCFKLGC